MKKKKNIELEVVKASRKLSREEEIKKHGKLLSYKKIFVSKRKYSRKKSDSEGIDD